MKKHLIQVRRYLPGQSNYGSASLGHITGNYGKFEFERTITRRVYAQQIGNFNPIFCRYAGKTYQVHSDEGDTSDPFRREESYAESFFINVDSPCEWNL